MPWLVPPSKAKKTKKKKRASKADRFTALGLSPGAARRAVKSNRKNGRRTN